MKELEPWQIERPLEEGYYIWQDREYRHIEGLTPWRSRAVLHVLEDGRMGSLGPDYQNFGSAPEIHRHYIMLWELAREGKEKRPKPPPGDLESIRHLFAESFANFEYRLMQVSQREAEEVAAKLWEDAEKYEENAPPVVGDWFVLVGELPPNTDDPGEIGDFTEGAYGRILDIQDEWRIIFRVLGVRQDPSLIVPVDDQVYPADPETGQADRSRRIRKIVDLELGKVYSVSVDDYEAIIFGNREMHEKETIPALKRRRAGWKHLQEGLSGRRR